MTPRTLIRVGLDPALSLLPDRMDSPAARAMVIAICLQESRILYRRQIKGPARGFAQFELGGIRGVLHHSATKGHAETVCGALEIEPSATAVHVAIEYSDVLACVFARLLLWTLPGRLPGPGEPERAWEQYSDAWRPGKPHRATWDSFFGQAWETVGPATEV